MVLVVWGWGERTILVDCEGLTSRGDALFSLLLFPGGVVLVFAFGLDN